VSAPPIAVGGATLAWRPRPDEADLKRQRKEAKLLAEASRVLDPRERYRALVDAVEEAHDLGEAADRKVRFALVVMAGLNLGLFAATTRPELLGPAHASLSGWLGACVLAYAVVGVYFFLQAVEALRPRGMAPSRPDAHEVHRPVLRDPEGALAPELGAYERAWGEVRFDQLNAELARECLVVARVNREKLAALRRLYGGLRVLALLFGGLVALAGLSALFAGVQP